MSTMQRLKADHEILRLALQTGGVKEVLGEVREDMEETAEAFNRLAESYEEDHPIAVLARRISEHVDGAGKCIGCAFDEIDEEWLERQITSRKEPQGQGASDPT